MISVIEPTASGTVVRTDDNHRLVKSFERQAECATKNNLYLLAGMQRPHFEEQASMLLAKLEVIESPPIDESDILVVLCLPFGSLKNRVAGLRCGRHAGVCDCNLHKFDTKYPPNSVHALIGVKDGRNRRVNGVGITRPSVIETLVAPDNPFTAWDAVDMSLFFPNILRQHGLIVGLSAVGNQSTALWITPKGQPIFGSTKGREFKRNFRHCRWGIPSYREMITLSDTV